jgi:hypothetical protein
LIGEVLVDAGAEGDDAEREGLAGLSGYDGSMEGGALRWLREQRKRDYTFAR